MNRPSTSPRQPATARGQRTRQQLLDAAERVFGKRGFDNTSIAEITQTAGVALGTFYVYFPDKASIFVHLVDERGHALRKLLSEATAGLKDRLEIERAGFKAFFEFCNDHRELYRIVRQAEFVDEAVFRRYYQRIAEGYVAGLREAMQDGQIRDLDPEVIAYSLMGIADFLGMRFVLWQSRAERERVLEQAMEFIRRGLEPRSGSTTPRTRSRG